MYNVFECSIAVSMDYSIRKYIIFLELNFIVSSIHLISLCWHSTPAYYAFYYADMLNIGLYTVQIRNSVIRPQLFAKQGIYQTIKY